MQNLKISLIQTNLHWEKPAANMAMFEEKIWTDIENTDVIILPEMFTTGFSMNAKQLAEPPFVNTFRWLQQISKESSALVLGSYIIRDGSSYFNRMYAVWPDGRSEYYDKRHLFTLANEQESYTAGTERLIIEWKGWKICPMICYDLRFPVWSRNRFEQLTHTYEYDLLVYSANWPKPRIEAWDALLKARAIENQSFVAGVNRVGVDGGGYEYVGHSGVYDFSGSQMVFNENKEIVLSEELDQGKMKEFRERFAFLRDADKFQFDK